MDLVSRTRVLHAGPLRPGAVIYWMSRDQRAQDNWALLFAQRLAVEHRRPLAVVFYLADRFLGAGERHYDLMLRGLAETEQALAHASIPFHVIHGDLVRAWTQAKRRLEVAALVTDFDPLRLKRQWQRSVIRALGVPAYEVDAHNIVPCWVASPKPEFGAYTLRPKIHRQLPEFLTSIPALRRHPFTGKGRPVRVDWDQVRARLKPDTAVGLVAGMLPGSRAGMAALRRFSRSGLRGYAEDRNDPLADGQSGLSPYLHFGQISAQRVALAVSASQVSLAAQQTFLEELIVRRELSDNFCYYHTDYDRTSAFPTWARITLEQHAMDPRAYLYSRKQFENAATHDPLWNAAQRQMVRSGKMHGYLRMYWAKKILEWSPTVEQALATAIQLNDKYSLDGRDPNGYAGIAWSLGGVHDRAWGARPVFGKIRYMSYGGCAAKFNVKAYMKRWEE